MKKSQTYEQLEATKAKAARFARDVLEDDDLADELVDESPESYAKRKHISIINPPERSTTNMANGNDNLTKSDLQDMCDQVEQILSEVYTPESSREELAAAIGDALGVLENGTEDTEADSDDDAHDQS